MTRTMHDTALYRSSQYCLPNSLQHAISPAQAHDYQYPKPKPRPKPIHSCLPGCALLLSLKPLFSQLPLVLILILSLSFLPRLEVSHGLLFLLSPIRSFLVRKLRNLLTFILLISFIAMLGFLFNVNPTSAVQRCPDQALTSKGKGQEKKKAQQIIEEADIDMWISNLLSSCTDAAAPVDRVTPDCNTHFGILHASEAESRFFEEYRGLGIADQHPQLASGAGQEEFSVSAARYRETPLRINGSVASRNATESVRLGATTTGASKKHSKSKSRNHSSASYGLDLNLEAVPSTSCSTVYGAEPSRILRRTKV